MVVFLLDIEALLLFYTYPLPGLRVIVHSRSLGRPRTVLQGKLENMMQNQYVEFFLKNAFFFDPYIGVLVRRQLA